MPPKYVAPTQKRNVLSPTLRRGKGWSMGQLEARYDTGVKNAVRIVFGSLIYKPSIGSEVEWARTQPLSERVAIGLKESIYRSVARLVPDISILEIVVDNDQAGERRTIDVRWGIPEQATRLGGEPQLALGPVTTTVRT